MQPKTQLGYILRDLFSGKDGYSLDIARILWALGVVQFLIISAVTIFMDKDFNYISWAAALGTVLAAGGTALRLKEPADPNKSVKDKET